MKGWFIEEYGGPDVLQFGELPEPDCGKNDLIIEMKATAVNPLDWKIRNGMLKRIRKAKFPLAMGSEVSGEVVEVGAAVENFVVGDQVFARVDKHRTGAWSEKVAVPASYAAQKPSEIAHNVCAGVPLAGLTAYQCLVDHGKLRSGQKVLIQAGAGGVGSLAIQIAKGLGAEVASTASAAKHELLRTLGADHPIDYRTQQFENVLSDYDLVLDTLGEEASIKAFGILKPGCKVLSISGPLDPQTAKDAGYPLWIRMAIFFLSRKVRSAAQKHGCDYRFVFMREDGKQLAMLAQMMSEGKLTAQVDRVFPFEKVNEAVAYAEKGHATGKVIISRDV